MLRIYAVGVKVKYDNVTCIDYTSFYLKRSDGETDIKEHRKIGEKGAFIIPIEVREEYMGEGLCAEL